MAIPRLVDPADVADAGADRLLEVMEIVLGILSMTHWSFGPADAIAVPTGQGEEWRITKAIELWEAGRAGRHLVCRQVLIKP
jgi:hypothetical protein